MRWSFRLGSLFGIPVYVHLTFLLLLGLVAVAQVLAAGPAAALGALVLILAIFGSVVLHEFGHALTARRFGIRTLDVTLWPIGGVARLERMPANPVHELWIALAGPAVNVAIAGLLGIWLFVTAPVAMAGGIGLTAGSLAGRLLAINLILALFNMLPAFPMDGGRVLRALLARKIGYVAGTEVAATVGRGMAIVFGIAGLFWSPMLMFIAIFVWFGAGQEAELARRGYGRFPPGGSYVATERPGVEVWEPDRSDPGAPAARERRYAYRVGPLIVYKRVWRPY